MTTRATPDLERLFSPASIAVIGATDTATSIGGMPMRYLTEFGYAGDVHPVNPKRDEVMGRRCYASIRDVPGEVDVALVAVAARLVPGIVRDCGVRGIPFALILSAGFGEAGEEGKALEAELRRAVAETGIRVVGPNCLGLLNIDKHVHCGFGQGLGERNYKLGPVALVTQSGGYGFTLVKNAHREGMGFHYVASIGNSYDLTVLDFVEWFLERPEIEVVSAFVEGVDDGRRLIRIGRRALELGKPILIWKAGTTEAGQSAAASHTASLAASYPLYQAAFREGGWTEVRDYEDFVDITRAFLGRTAPKGNNLCIVTGSGGAGVVASDRYEEAGLTLPPISPQTAAALAGVMPEFGVIANPVDISGQRSKDGTSASNRAVEVVLEDPDIDMVMVRSQQTTGSAKAAEALADIRDRAGKPVFVTMGADDATEARAVFDARRVPWHLTVSRAAPAARALADFAARRREPAGEEPSRHFTPDKIDLSGSGMYLAEWQSRQVLAAYGMPALNATFVSETEIETLVSADLPFPVALKAHAAEIPHKSEAGAIRLGLRSGAEAHRAARDVIASARAFDRTADVDGVLVQPMASGIEVILGAVNDPCFGPVVMFGLGGILTEVMQDVTYGFAPVDHAAAKRMIRGITGFRILAGYRGQPPADLEALADLISRLSWLISDHADSIASIDVNPVFVAGSRLTIADALVVRRECG